MSDFKSYSQYGEDIILQNLLGDSGYFLEVGAYSPTIFSNTRFLVERKWGGCYVDGSPSALNRFIGEYIDNDNITIVNSLVGDKHTVIPFFDSNGDGISSTDFQWTEKWRIGSGSKFKKIYASMITFESLYSLLPTTVDFINIDVEGQSAYISTLVDYNRLNTKVVCVEHDNQVEKLVSFFQKIGFKMNFYNSCNAIFAKVN
jgi:hypothetical protein